MYKKGAVKKSDKNARVKTLAFFYYDGHINALW